MKAKKTKMQILSKAIAGCHKCRLGRTRKKPVVGEGPEDAEIIFIGEAPGRNEEIEGRPFVGKAGKIFDALLQEVKIDRDKVYITNIVKCRPPDNRDPTKKEIHACLPYLFQQIEIIQPKVIICLGRIASKALFKKLQLSFSKISQMHGKSFFVQMPYGKVKIGCLYHPAVACYQNSMFDILKRDLKKILFKKV